MAERLNLEQMQEMLSEALANIDKISRELWTLRDEYWTREEGEEQPMKYSRRVVNRCKKNIEELSRQIDSEYSWTVHREYPESSDIKMVKHEV